MKLFDYQVEYISDLPKNCIMGADVSTGKTFMSLEHYRRYGVGRPLLVLAPASKVKTHDWHRDIERWLGKDEPKQWWVISYDKFGRRPETYMGIPNLCVIADECHFICNSQTKRSKGVRKIASYADQFIGLSATPLPNGWSSIENFAILFGLVRNKTEFKFKYVMEDRSRGYPVVLGYRNEKELKSFWNKISKKLDRDGNVDLPELLKIPVKIEFKERERVIYQRTKRTRIAPNGEILDSPPKFMAHLRQSLAPMREDALISILESAPNDHIVIFYNYDVERDMILKAIPKLECKREVWEQSGHASNLPKREIWDTMPPSVTLAQYQSASAAIELTYAHITVFLSPTYSFANFYQAMGRTHRHGQKHKVLYYLLSIGGSLDQNVWLALGKKENFDETVWLEELPMDT